MTVVSSVNETNVDKGGLEIRGVAIQSYTLKQQTTWSTRTHLLEHRDLRDLG